MLLATAVPVRVRTVALVISSPAPPLLGENVVMVGVAGGTVSTVTLSALDAVLSKRTRLVALNAASNLTGSINDVARLVARVHEAGALAFVDAVQFSPHEFTDVKQLGCDFLACSSYASYP